MELLDLTGPLFELVERPAELDPGTEGEEVEEMEGRLERVDTVDSLSELAEPGLVNCDEDEAL